MYGIFTYIYPENHPNVGKYTIHGASGYGASTHAGTPIAIARWMDGWFGTHGTSHRSIHGWFLGESPRCRWMRTHAALDWLVELLVELMTHNMTHDTWNWNGLHHPWWILGIVWWHCFINITWPENPDTKILRYHIPRYPESWESFRLHIIVIPTNYIPLLQKISGESIRRSPAMAYPDSSWWSIPRRLSASSAAPACCAGRVSRRRLHSRSPAPTGPAACLILGVFFLWGGVLSRKMRV